MSRGALCGVIFVTLLLGAHAAQAGESRHHHRRSHHHAAATVQSAPVAVAARPAPPIAKEPEVEPPPNEVEPPPIEVEPPPAALREELVEHKPDPKLEAEKQALARRHRLFSGLGWTSAAITIGLVVSGTTLGVLAQKRSDDLSLLTVQKDNGIAPIYDADQRSTYEQLQLDGQRFSRATIGCFIAGGVAAIGTGLLFYGQNRTEAAQDKLSLIPVLTGNTTGLALIGRF